MGIHGDKSQQERDWVLNGELAQEPVVPVPVPVPDRRCKGSGGDGWVLADVASVPFQSSATAKLPS